MSTEQHSGKGKAGELAYESLLLVTALIWGLGFVAQRVGMQNIPPFAFNMARFALGSLALVPLIRLRRTGRAMVKACIRPGLIAGLVLTLGASFQQYGMQFTSAGKGGFITGLYVVLVPLAAIALGKKTSGRTWLAALLTFGGLFLLSVNSDFSINRGDVFVLVGAVFWAAHILVLDRYAPRVDPVVLASVQFALCAVLNGLLSVLTERATAQGFAGAVGAIAFSGFLTIGLGFTLQAVAQTKAHPARASIILSLEAAFAALGGWLLLSERLSSRELLGCGIMLFGMILAQIPIRQSKTAVAAKPA